jgi:hypothetical protein
MPDNVFVLWLIAALFPSARIILCRRDPRDVSLYCYFHRFTEGHLFAYDLADCRLRALEVGRVEALVENAATPDAGNPLRGAGR